MAPLDVLTAGEPMVLFAAQRPGALEEVHTFARSVAGAELNVAIDDAARPTGFMLKSRSDDGSDPRTEYFRGGSAASAIDASNLPPDACRGARHLHLTGLGAAGVRRGAAADRAGHAGSHRRPLPRTRRARCGDQAGRARRETSVRWPRAILSRSRRWVKEAAAAALVVLQG